MINVELSTKNDKFIKNFFDEKRELKYRYAAGSEPKGFMLKLNHLSFECYSSGGGEAAEFAIASDYTVAGDNQRQWIFGKSAADCPACVGSA